MATGQPNGRQRSWESRSTGPAKEGPERLAEILSRLFTARGWGRRQDRLRLDEAWAAAAGPEFARHTRVIGLRRGVFEVEVANAVVRQELAHFHKRRVLDALRTKLAGVTIGDLKFRSG